MMLNKILAIIFYIISIILLICYGLLDVVSSITLSEFGRLFLLCGSCLFLYFGGLFISKYRNDKKAMKINLWIFFILYCILLITLTLFDPIWGRNGIEIPKWSIANFKIYLENNSNIVPFKTIFTYINQFNSLYSTKQVLLNLLGNIFAFIPMAFFLPILFKKEKNIKHFVITMLIMIFGIEILQLITTSGRFYIDDLILNLFGTIMAYLLINKKSINQLIRNVFLLEKNKISKKIYIKIIIIIVICLISTIFLIFYRNNLYNQNLDNFNKKHNPSISFEYDKECSSNNLFYEDEIYKYYFECYDSSKFYAIVNNDEKLSIEKLCNDSEYLVDINRILSIMEYNKIKYKIENKYMYFLLEEENVDNNSYSVTKYIDSDIAKIVVIDKSKEENIELEVNIIPKKVGKQTINIPLELYNDKGEKNVLTKKIEIIISENLSVEYNILN